MWAYFTGLVQKDNLRAEDIKVQHTIEPAICDNTICSINVGFYIDIDLCYTTAWH